MAGIGQEQPPHVLRGQPELGAVLLDSGVSQLFLAAGSTQACAR
jgi:hypothetical protein